MLEPLPEPPVKPAFDDLSGLSKEIETHEGTISQAREALEKQKEDQHTALAEPQREISILTSQIYSLKTGLKAAFCPTCKRTFEKAEESNRHIQDEANKLDKKLKIRTAEVAALTSGYASDNADFAGEIRELEKQVKKLRVELNAGKDAELLYTRHLREYERTCQVTRTKFESESALVNKRYEAAIANYSLAKQRLEDRIAAIQAVVPGDPAL